MDFFFKLLLFIISGIFGFLFLLLLLPIVIIILFPIMLVSLIMSLMGRPVVVGGSFGRGTNSQNKENSNRYDVPASEDIIDVNVVELKDKEIE